MYPGDVSSSLQRLATCVEDLQSWCASHRLQLNAVKAELIRFGQLTGKLTLDDATGP